MSVESARVCASVWASDMSLSSIECVLFYRMCSARVYGRATCGRYRMCSARVYGRATCGRHVYMYACNTCTCCLGFISNATQSLRCYALRSSVYSVFSCLECVLFYWMCCAQHCQRGAWMRERQQVECVLVLLNTVKETQNILQNTFHRGEHILLDVSLQNTVQETHGCERESSLCARERLRAHTHTHTRWRFLAS